MTIKSLAWRLRNETSASNRSFLPSLEGGMLMTLKFAAAGLVALGAAALSSGSASAMPIGLRPMPTLHPTWSRSAGCAAPIGAGGGRTITAPMAIMAARDTTDTVARDTTGGGGAGATAGKAASKVSSSSDRAPSRAPCIIPRPEDQISRHTHVVAPQRANLREMSLLRAKPRGYHGLVRPGVCRPATSCVGPTSQR
jgi:hypothetical protein